MDDIGAFMRVDSGKEQEFENDVDAHYQWIIVPEDEDEADIDDMNMDGADMDDDQVALEDIMIGFRHSYGGYHRLLKQYRQAGIDPTQQAARDLAAKKKDVGTPVSPLSPDQIAFGNEEKKDDEPLSPEHQRNKSDKIDALKQHIRNKSEKMIQKLKKTDSKDTKEPHIEHVTHEKEKGSESLSERDKEKLNNMIKQQTKTTSMANIAKPKLAVIPSADSEINTMNNNNKAPTTELTNIRSGPIPQTASKKNLMLKRQQTAPDTGAQSKANLFAIHENATSQNDGYVAPNLNKSKSVLSMNKPLQKHGSSKNILLRHLDRK